MYYEELIAIYQESLVQSFGPTVSSLPARVKIASKAGFLRPERLLLLHPQMRINRKPSVFDLIFAF